MTAKLQFSGRLSPVTGGDLRGQGPNVGRWEGGRGGREWS